MSKIILKCKKNAGPVGVTFETEQNKDGGLTPKISTKFSYAKFNVDKAQVKADGSRILETSIKVTPDVKVSFKASKGADLFLDYTQQNFYATGSVDVLELSNATASACYGLPNGIQMGGDARWSFRGNSGLVGYSLGASYKTGPVACSLTTTKFSSYFLGMMYKVNDSLTLASQTSHSVGKPLDDISIGGAYVMPNIGTFKAKAANNGLLFACFTKEIAPKVTLTASGSMAANDVSSFKPGLSINM